MSLSPADLELRQSLAEAVAREAGCLAWRYFLARETLAVELKGPQDLVSLADREVEALIRRRFAAVVPEDAVVGEEEGGEAAAVAWYVDPIDGTQNFLRGLPLFTVSIALQVEGRTAVGVVYDPGQDELFSARAGGGAFCDGRPLRVSAAESLERAVVGVGHSPRHPQERFLEPFGRLLRAGAQTRNYCAAALQLAHVAAGRLDATWDAYLLPWDVLAGILLVEEAGGAAEPFRPGRLYPGADTLLAGTPRLLEALQALRLTCPLPCQPAGAVP